MPSDRRVRRTQKLLHNALIALILEKGYRNVTIQDVAERADIGYRTFFRHYDGLDALLLDVVQSVMNELDERLDIYRPVENLSGAMTQKGAQLFAYVREHEPIFRVLLLDDSVRFLLQPLLQRVRARVEQALMALTDTPLPLSVVANHLTLSTLALMRWWLEFDFPYDARRMGQIFVELIMRPTWQALSGGTTD